MRLFFILLTILFLSTPAHAAITFTGGHWETTFNCPDWLTYSDTLSCDGLSKNLASTCSGSYEQVISSANNSSGGGVKGQRHWYGSGKNTNSGGTYASFGATYSEIWVRWYQRHDSNMVDGLNHTNKMLYFDDPNGQGITFGFNGTDGFRFWVVSNDSLNDIYASSTGYGWNSLISDGNWHAYEIHMKLDTNNSDGILRAWIDGNLVIDVTNADSGETAAGGWIGTIIGANHDFFTSSCMANDIDDISIYVTTPPNTDGSGNPYIGLLGVSTGPVLTATDIPDQPYTATSVTPSVTATDDVSITGCRWATTDIATYAGMTNSMTNVGGLYTASSDLTVSAGNGYTNYYICIDGDSNEGKANDSFNVAATPTCSDGIQNQDETGIDCGGVCPACAAETCSDGIQNQDETGIDCGGVCDPCSSLYDIPSKSSLLLSESFEDDNWTSRNWYDGTTSTGTAAGGYSGNALRWTFASAATQPTGFSTIRKAFTNTDEFLIEYYVNYESGWQGSGQVYHPHLIHIQTNYDTDYQSPSRANGSIYFESLADSSSPYTNYPQVALQDYHRVNEAYGVPPQDLIATTETRSAAQCNTPYALSGADIGTCYNDGSGWWSANTWQPSAVAIPSGEWVKITGYVKRNTFTGGTGNFDGILKLWVNDTLAIDSTTVLYSAGAYQDTEWNKILLAPYIGDGSPVAQSMWLDELEVWSVDGVAQSYFPTGSIPLLN